MKVLAVNGGSSNVTVAVVDDVHRTGGQVLPQADPAAFADLVAATRPDGVGHRVVHGGPPLVAPARIATEVLAELDVLVPFAPLHLPPAVACVRAITET